MEWKEMFITGVVFVLGFSIGGTFSDIDLAPPLPIRHRSAWTHGPFIPLALWAASSGGLWWAYFALGFLPAYAIHLIYDMFPKKWTGGARVSWYPLTGWRMGGLLSFLFLAGSAALAGWMTYTLATGEFANLRIAFLG
ncbi:MAG: hypothetical protein DRJ03_16340 [Chloroflexi bacterium]|nr:MAG: hypothetical protein DRJ03_16340 [Chloroflexota bacterium]